MDVNGLQYMPGVSVGEFEEEFTRRFPDFAPALWLQRPGSQSVIEAMRRESNEFDSDAPGRGDSFRRAHERSSVKAVGMSKLLQMATRRPDIADLPPAYRLLDVLGGDGTLVRVSRELPEWRTDLNWILTGDVSTGMVRQALERGLPAVRQPAQFLLCREDAFDAVLIAYGAHHIPVPERTAAYREALRVLRPGGRLVVHDFEVGSPMARWFEEVVHTYSPTGHRYTHFSRNDFTTDLEAVGFADVQVSTIYDPITVRGDSRDEVRTRILDYVLNAYRLTPGKAGDTDGDETAAGDDTRRSWAEKLVTDCLLYTADDLDPLESVAPAVRESGTLSIYQTPAGWAAELPRVALVAVATRA